MRHLAALALAMAMPPDAFNHGARTEEAPKLREATSNNDGLSFFTRSVYLGELPSWDTGDVDVDAVVREARAKRKANFLKLKNA